MSVGRLSLNADELIDEVQMEFQQMGRIVRELEAFEADVGDGPATLREEAAAGQFLASFYLGVENVLKRVTWYHGVETTVITSVARGAVLVVLLAASEPHAAARALPGIARRGHEAVPPVSARRSPRVWYRTEVGADDRGHPKHATGLRAVSRHPGDGSLSTTCRLIFQVPNSNWLDNEDKAGFFPLSTGQF